jgi:hypothetical protein
VDGKALVDNGGIHGNQEQCASRGLVAGLHKIAVSWFQAGGGENLMVYYRYCFFTETLNVNYKPKHFPDLCYVSKLSFQWARHWREKAFPAQHRRMGAPPASSVCVACQCVQNDFCSILNA